MEYNPNAQGPAPAPTPAEQAYNDRATTAMVLGIIGVAVFFLPVVNIAGLVLSIIALVKARQNRAFAAQHAIRESGANTAGYVCGLVGVIIGGAGVLITILAVVLFLSLAIGAVSLGQLSLPYISSTIEEAMPALSGAAGDALAGILALL